MTATQLDRLMTMTVMVTRINVQMMISKVLTELVMMPSCFGRRR
jgi:hypothetical protein